jgi:hypothetical protein
MSFKDAYPPENEGLELDLKAGATEPCLGQDASSKPLNLRDQQIKTETQRYSESIPSKFRPNYLKATSSTGGKAASIKAKCLECMGYEDGPNRVRACSTVTCPLWRVRPYQE